MLPVCVNTYLLQPVDVDVRFSMAYLIYLLMSLLNPVCRLFSEMTLMK